MKKYFIIIIACLFLISCSKKREKITDISQLKDKQICVLTGSAGDLAARKTFPNAAFLDMVGSSDAGLAVKTGKADAFVYDKSILQKIVEKNPELEILEKPISRLELAIAVNKENLELLSRLNEAINSLKNNGALDSLKRKWIESNYATSPPQIQEPKISGLNSTLKMGTCALYEPYTFVANGKHTGFDIELSSLLGKILNVKIEIIDMNFEALIPALQTRKIDFALSDFTITEERKKLISFTEPYIVNDISALVKK
jgi:polar amino acid transport system substrate-binding protein